jgi:pyridinium-3,5-bisthiocarboxylic acid mononucleotide nickel chelatase
LMCALADEFGPMPLINVTSVGYGAGSADIAGRPNVVQVVVGDGAATNLIPEPGQIVRLFETNLDDATGEVIAHTIASLIAAGAHDAWASPIVMKKGRPAHTVHVLCDPSMAPLIGALLLRETGSLGLRGTDLRRWPQQRSERQVTIDGHTVRAKVALGRVKVEYDDAAAAATALGRPLRDVLAQASALAERDIQ